MLGAGGHAKVVIEVLRQTHPELQLVGCLAAEASGDTILGVPILGGDDRLAQLRSHEVEHAFVAIGDNRLRERLAARARSLDYVLPALISPAAHVSPSARIEAGAAIFAGAAIQAEALVEPLAIINTAASVDHDCVVGAAAHVGPGAVLAGGVVLGARAFVGAGAVVIPKIQVGEDAVVGAGACLVRDAPPSSTMIGVPARPLRVRET